jgi:hypothetical protein
VRECWLAGRLQATECACVCVCVCVFATMDHKKYTTQCELLLLYKGFFFTKKTSKKWPNFEKPKKKINLIFKIKKKTKKKPKDSNDGIFRQ